MSDQILIFYGSYRSDRQGIHLADWLVRAFAKCFDETHWVVRPDVVVDRLRQKQKL